MARRARRSRLLPTLSACIRHVSFESSRQAQPGSPVRAAPAFALAKPQPTFPPVHIDDFSSESQPAAKPLQRRSKWVAQPAVGTVSAQTLSTCRRELTLADFYTKAGSVGVSRKSWYRCERRPPSFGEEFVGDGDPGPHGCPAAWPRHRTSTRARWTLNAQPRSWIRRGGRLTPGAFLTIRFFQTFRSSARRRPKPHPRALSNDAALGLTNLGACE